MSSQSQETEQTECPTCGDTFASLKGMSVHHTKSHGESVETRNEYECDFCGSITLIQPCRMGDSENHFCDVECRQNWQSENWNGSNHPRAEPEKYSEFECEWCGDTFTKPEYQVRDNDRVFCSKPCSASWKKSSDEWGGESHPTWNRVEFNCNWCGEKTSKKDSQYEEDGTNLCSIECFRGWHSDTFSGEDHWLWKDGSGLVENFGSNWEDVKEVVRIRDGNVCQLCGTLCDDKLPNVHHIVPRRLFDMWEDVVEGVELEHSNTPRNLISLCDGCHMSVEQGGTVSPVPDSNWRSSQADD